jgi:cyclopropane fatty-acyl-phospholipid synthase-like methyltransferase
MNNYEFCAKYAESHLQSGARVLDYGCGAGLIVKLLRKRGLDAVGCDIFFEGGDRLSEIATEELGVTIFRMEGDKIPFREAFTNLSTRRASSRGCTRPPGSS